MYKKTFDDFGIDTTEVSQIFARRSKRRDGTDTVLHGP